MKKSICLLLIAVLGSAFMFGKVINMRASALANEEPLAGISLTLGKYYGKVEENLDNKDETTEVKLGVTAQETKDETALEDKEEEKKPEEIVLNISYDRLGISKVDNYLNIREKPSEDGTIIGKLPKNAGCNVESVENGWAKIKSGKVSGYVSAEFLILDKEAEAYAKKIARKVAYVNTGILNVRFLPSTDSKIYDLMAADENIDVEKEKLTAEYINNFIKENYKDNDEIFSGVNQEEMMKQLDNWICVSIDNEQAFVAKEFVDIVYTLDRAVPIQELAEDGSGGVSSLRAKMVQYAKQFLGNKYVYGGTNLTKGIDCSAFMMRIYEHFEYKIPRTSRTQAEFVMTITKDQAKPGDLYFYGNGSRISHVAMYIGNGQIIHASNHIDGIKISNANYRTPMKVGRIIKD